MSDSGDMVVRDLAGGQSRRLRWSGGRIQSLEPSSEASPTLPWLAPPLVDLQINGYAGVDFQQDAVTSGQLEQAARGLHRDGCARWFLTLITDHWPVLLERFRHLKELRDRHPWLARVIAGWHIEGPFLSDRPGYAGAHDAAAMRDPAPADMEALRQIAGEDRLLVTLAPERAGAVAAIQAARRLGITVSLGHTNAAAQHLREAVAAGAAAFTHLGNGCPRELDRHDNIIWRVLDNPELTVSFIVDGIHVSPALLRLAWRVLGRDRIYFTTDAMAAAGAPPGRYQLGRTMIEVGADQVVRQPGSPLFAGSALQPVEGIRRAGRMLQMGWRDLWPAFALNPARLAGCHAPLEPGQPATFQLIRTAEDHTLASIQTCLQGQWDVSALEANS